jgi:hypothetical protein
VAGVTAATIVDTEPAPTPAEDDDTDDLIHYACCDMTVAMCGVGGLEEDVEEHPGVLCPLCQLAVDEGWPCTIPGCVTPGEP